MRLLPDAPTDPDVRISLIRFPGTGGLSPPKTKQAEDVYSCLTTPVTHRVTLSNFTALRPIPTIWIYSDTSSDGLGFFIDDSLKHLAYKF